MWDLVTLAYNDEHLDVDDHKAKELPNFACTHFACKFSRDHGEVKLLTLAKVYFFLLHSIAPFL
jgi:hypothetical protein